MKAIFLTIFLISSLFALDQKESMMNNIKSLIQKEEYIALALNKYILQTGNIPKINGKVDIKSLKDKNYLDKNFNDINPYTNTLIDIIVDEKNNIFIKGIVAVKDNDKYLYNFYTDSKFRVNTIPPEDTTDKEKLKVNLLKGSQVLYHKTQKEIQKVLNNTNEKILLEKDECIKSKYFHELANEELILKYCKNNGTKIQVYQNGPLFLEDISDLKIIIANPGDKAYVKDGNSYTEYYFEGDEGWVSAVTGETLTGEKTDLTFEDIVLNYIPDAKDLVLRENGGCMLANGDIFCFGNNEYKQAGIESYGQIDTTLKPDYVNTPVMLKVQNENIKTGDSSIPELKIKDLNWYNNPYRIKFEKMAMNDKNVCGISPIFENFKDSKRYKSGGELYCNGLINEAQFEGITGSNVKTSILSKNKNIGDLRKINGIDDGLYKENAIYLKDIVMVNGAIIVLSDKGEIYSFGSNEKGQLGRVDNPVGTLGKVNHPEQKKFKAIFALRDIKGLGALDADNYFYIWGERPNDKIYTKPVILSNSMKFYEDAIFVNSKEFVLKASDNNYYRTYADNGILNLNINNVMGVSVYDYNGEQYLLYVNESMQLVGSRELLECREGNFKSCNSTDTKIFETAFGKLNEPETEINNKKYANFSNVSIYQSSEEGTNTTVDYGFVYTWNFEGSNPDTDTDGWNNKTVYRPGGTLSTSQFLGPFGNKTTGYSGQTNYITANGTQQISKKFSLPNFANENVKISFDMYELGSWDTDNTIYTPTNKIPEKFYIYINDKLVRNDMYGRISGVIKETKVGENLADIKVQSANSSSTTTNLNVRKHKYEFAVKLNGSGEVTLGFGANLNEDYINESFGIDNVVITKQIDNVKITNDEYSENFNDSNYDYWIIPQGIQKDNQLYKDIYFSYPIYEAEGTVTKFLGKFGKLGTTPVFFGGNDGTEQVYKIFSFGKQNGNKTIELAFDFYIIDKWSEVSTDKEVFNIFVNGMKEIVYEASKHSTYSPVEISIPNTDSSKDYKINIKKDVKLDKYGNVKIGFGSFNVNNTRTIDNLSWGIDNIKFKVKNDIGGIGGVSSKKIPYVCAMTGLGSASQMYCWGNTARSLPILSTSLYDVSKIDSINKLFVTQTSDLGKQMTFEKFNNNGKLFLRYPTYIGGFDYPFYFK